MLIWDNHIGLRTATLFIKTLSSTLSIWMWNMSQIICNKVYIFLYIIANSYFVHYAYRSELKSHTEMHEAESLPGSLIRSCGLCKQVFRNTAGLRMHIRIKHSTVNSAASRKSSNRKRLTTLRHKSGAKKYECDICGKIVWLKRLMLRHMQRRHQKGLPFKKQIHRTVETKKNNHEQCHLCPIRCCNIYKIRRHYRAHHSAQEVAHICQSCNTQFSNFFEFYEHRTPNGQVYKCQPCGVHLSCKMMHAKHMEAHATKDTTCEVSGHFQIFL